MSAVQNAVQNGIENLSGTSINSNTHPGQRYLFPARSREELLASQDQAADARAVPRHEDPLDPAAASPSPKAKEPEGWIL